MRAVVRQKIQPNANSENFKGASADVISLD